MSKSRLCAYASCQSTDTPIKVNLGDARPSFCSMLHAAAYLINRMKWAGPEPTASNPEQDELRRQAESALDEIDRLKQLAKAEGAGA